MKKSSLLFALALSLTTVLSSCDELTGGNSYTMPTPSAEEQYMDKYNGYVDDLYDLNERVLAVYEGYYESAKDVTPDANGYANHTIGYNSINDLTVSAVDDVLALEPAMPGLDEHVAASQKHVKALTAVMAEMNVYEKRGDAEADNYAKGAEFYPRFDKAMTAYLDEFTKIEAEVLKIQEVLMAKDAERYKEEGLTIRYELIMGMNAGNKVVDLATAIEEGTADDGAVAQFNTAVAEFTRASDALIKDVKDKEKVEKELGRFGAMYMDNWLNASADLIKQSREFVVRAEKSDWAVSNGYSYQAAAGSSARLSEEYNKMVGEYNSMINMPI